MCLHQAQTDPEYRSVSTPGNQRVVCATQMRGTYDPLTARRLCVVSDDDEEQYQYLESLYEYAANTYAKDVFNFLFQACVLF